MLFYNGNHRLETEQRDVMIAGPCNPNQVPP